MVLHAPKQFSYCHLGNGFVFYCYRRCFVSQVLDFTKKYASYKTLIDLKSVLRAD